MEQFKQFNVEKQVALNELEQLRAILNELDEMGVDVGRELGKIDSAVRDVEADFLRIALLGAFSDGKTSVIAAWLGRVMEDMKIDMDESSDSLAFYSPEGLPEKCQIIDTPGLFGDKEQTIDEKSTMYEDMTKRYISEAHLILYVVDATNPLKESHNDIVKWVLRDLNKLSSIVFVINKMDEVTDLSEQALFDTQAKIKRENLKSKLQRAANLSPEEVAQLNIVCVASNPNGRGLKFWFGKPEHYEGRSRINDLKAMTTKVLRESTPVALIAKTGMDVVRHVVGEHVVLAEVQLAQLKVLADQNAEESKRIQDDISAGKKKVKQLARELFTELDNLEKSMLATLRPLGMENIQGFIEDELGCIDDSVGYKLNLNIKNAIDRSFDQSSKVSDQISLKIGRQLDSSESFISAMSDNALRAAGGAVKGISSLSPSVIKGGVVAARDLLSAATGATLKFKPWQATKIAGSISKWAGPAGAAISIAADIRMAYKAHEQEQELISIKNDIGDAIKGSFKDIYGILLDDEKVFEYFAPQLKTFGEVLKNIEGNADLIGARQSKLHGVKKKLNELVLDSVQVEPSRYAKVR